MKYITRWHIKEHNMEAAVERFTQAPPELPEGLTMHGRWHEMATGRGFAFLETDDPVALSKYLLAWSDLVDQEVHPVVGDDKYGANTVATRWRERGLRRMFLHAAELQIDYDGCRLVFEADLPADLQRVLERLDAAE